MTHSPGYDYLNYPHSKFSERNTPMVDAENPDPINNMTSNPSVPTSGSYSLGLEHGYTRRKPIANMADYQAGYEKGIRYNVDSGFMPAKTAREYLLGFRDYFDGDTVDDAQTVAYDPVKIPEHYNKGTIEVANFIADQELAYPKDNIIKYVVRAGKKDFVTELQDIEKAAAYLQMAYNLAQGLPAVVRDPKTKEVVWTLFRNEKESKYTQKINFSESINTVKLNEVYREAANKLGEV